MSCVQERATDGQGQTSTLPGVMRPSPSALSIMLRPILSFTLEHGSMDSSFAATRALLPFVTSFKYTSGVFPAVSFGEKMQLRISTLQCAAVRNHLACSHTKSAQRLRLGVGTACDARRQAVDVLSKVQDGTRDAS